MSEASWNLQRLLEPFSAEVFCQDHWEKAPICVARRDPGYFESLFSIADVDALLTLTANLPTARARLVQSRNGQVVSKAVPVTDDGICNMYLLYRSYYDEGYSLTVDRLDLRWRQVAALCKAIENTLHHPVAANLYLTPPQAQAFPAHFDTHEVFILQLEGSKQWRIYDSHIDLPLGDTPSTISADTLPPPRETMVLAAGDLLYIPRGWVHEATTATEASLHLTLGVHVFRWADLISEALTLAARADRRFRRALPIGFMDQEGGSLGAEFAELLRLLACEADCEAARWRVGQRLISNGQPLPDGHFVSLSQVSSLDQDTRVARRPGLMCKVISSASGASIHFNGNAVSAPRAIEPALQFLVVNEKFAVRDLPDCLADEDKVVLAGRLVREGLLTIVQPA